MELLANHFRVVGAFIVRYIHTGRSVGTHMIQLLVFVFVWKRKVT